MSWWAVLWIAVSFAVVNVAVWSPRTIARCRPLTRAWDVYYSGVSWVLNKAGARRS